MKILNQLLLLSFCCLSLAGHAAYIYVDHSVNTPATNAGTTWDFAYNKLEDALASANSGDIIRVSQGTYTSPYAGFPLKNDVQIYGGYPQKGTVLDFYRNLFRNANNYPTILQGSGNIVIKAQTTGNNAVINGFQVHTSTTGVSLYNTSPTFVDCKFSGTGRGVKMEGINSNISPKFINCSFSNSIAGIQIDLFSNSKVVSPQFTGCTFSQSINGVVLNPESGILTPYFERCTFKNLSGYAITNGTSGIGSAFVQTCPVPGYFDYHPSIVNSVFHNNGGVINVLVSTGCPTKTDVSTRFLNCTFFNNAPSSGHPAFNISTNNQHFDYDNSSYALKLDNCISWNNKNSNGKLMRLEIAMRIQVKNSLIEANSCNSIPFNIDPAFILTNPDSTTSQPRHQVIDLGGNKFNQNPQFVNANLATPNLNLLASSPARNSGNNSLIPISLELDMARRIRIVENVVDMGAFEYCPTTNGCYPKAKSKVSPIGPFTPASFKKATSVNKTTAMSNTITAYPNPFKATFQLNKNNDEEAQIRIFNITGSLILDQTWIGNQTEINLENYPDGIYTIAIQNKTSTVIKKMIKK